MQRFGIKECFVYEFSYESNIVMKATFENLIDIRIL